MLLWILLNLSKYWTPRITDVGAPLILQNFSRHLVNTPLIVDLDTSSLSPGAGSSRSASAYPIAFCVAEFNFALSSRIRKRQNFFAISSWRLSTVYWSVWFWPLKSRAQLIKRLPACTVPLKYQQWIRRTRALLRWHYPRAPFRWHRGSRSIPRNLRENQQR